ncbi:hypothetical protein GCM10011391_34390 [Pullulanibacillus camelliae]|uniref:Uncharacterized protein n=1 Tax=Pullulanibacillus camelliae TaxID=1707096 RepID=A0A8J2YL77_9BACL|nr:hypothetical protein [Pullulanibacillus camelliae]GGE52667.1 hypothetical protein GCM10011391_34390 [Pullulanibacillus camelliae]
MNVIHYDRGFNANEWAIIISIIVGILVVLILPKRFTKKKSAIYLLCGVFFGFCFDHTLSVLPVNYYDLNDSSQFEVTDFLSQVMYAAFGYLFFYLYDYLKLRLRFALVYILIWTFISIGIEKLYSLLGVFHYQHGYNIFYSFDIYLLVQSIFVVIYYIIEGYGDRQF